MNFRSIRCPQITVLGGYYITYLRSQTATILGEKFHLNQPEKVIVLVQ
jgi:hypothetical protein